MARPLILLDRDGVINVDLPKGVLKLSEFELLPRALDAIKMLSDAGIAIAICTNQSAIEKGWMQQETLEEIHAYLLQQVAQHGGTINAIYFAPDHPDTPSTRRKPAPGMLLEALADFGALAENTPFVGDAATDMQAASAAGCPRVCVRTGKGEATIAVGFDANIAPVTQCDDLYEAAQHYLQHYAGGMQPDILG